MSSKDSLKNKHLLICGSDEFAVKNRATEAARALAPEDSMNFETVNGYADLEKEDVALRQIASVMEALQTLPFFGGRKVVHFKDVNFLGDDALGRNAQVLASLEKLAELLSSLPTESAQLIMSAIGVDKRRSFFKAFSKFGQVEAFDKVDLSRERDFGAWVEEVEERMSAAGLQADPLVVERLVELVGNDSRALQGEIEKIKLYVHPKTQVEENDLRAIASESRSMVIWDLCDAVTFGKTTEAVRLLKKLLAQKETEVGILILLSNHIRLAALVNYLKETKRLRLSQRGSFFNVELMGDAEDFLPVNKKGEKPSTFRLGRIVQQSKNRSSAQWWQAMEILHATHHQLFQSGSDTVRVLETAVLQLCLL